MDVTGTNTRKGKPAASALAMDYCLGMTNKAYNTAATIAINDLLNGTG